MNSIFFGMLLFENNITQIAFDFPAWENFSHLNVNYSFIIPTVGHQFVNEWGQQSTILWRGLDGGGGGWFFLLEGVDV